MIFKQSPIRIIHKNLTEQEQMLKDVSAEITVGTDSRSFLWKQVEAIKRRINHLKIKLNSWGNGIPITQVKFGRYVEPDERYTSKGQNLVTNIILYPTHDDEEIKILIFRDFGDVQPLSIVKLFTGEKWIKTK